MNRRIERKEVFLNKIRRFSFVIFLKRISPFLIVLILVFISFPLGFWNFKKSEYSNSEFKYVNTQELDSYISEFKGVNIFLLIPSQVEKKILDSNGYIKRANIKKILPNKLSITIEEYEPFFAGYSSDSCMLFSKEGKKMDDICTNCEEECANLVSDIYIIYILSDSILESNKSLIFVDEFTKIYRVLLEFGYESIEFSVNDGITVVKDKLDHLFVFDLANDLDIQLSRMYLVGGKINKDLIEFKRLDLRFERPVMNIK